MEGLKRWRGRIALVTGASGGIGEGIARALAGIGMQVAIAARRRERLDELADELRQGGAQVLVCTGDVGKEPDVLGIFDTINRQWGAVDRAGQQRGHRHDEQSGKRQMAGLVRHA